MELTAETIKDITSHGKEEIIEDKYIQSGQQLVYIIDNEADAGGVGEPGLPPFAPALTNAVFDLMGKRIRKLPFKLSEV